MLQMYAQQPCQCLVHPWSDIGKLQLHPSCGLLSAAKQELLQQVKDLHAKTPVLQPCTFSKAAAYKAVQCLYCTALQLYCAEHAVQLDSCSQVQGVSAETSLWVMLAVLALLLL